MHSWAAISIRALVLAAVGAAAGLAIGATKPGGLQLVAKPRAAECEAPAIEPKRIGPAEAATLCARDKLLVADARPAVDFAAGHIAGAVHLPCDASGEVATSALGRGHTSVLVYGSSTEEAVTVARTVAQRTSMQVYALEGGFAAWERAGLACASGACEGCALQMSK